MQSTKLKSIMAIALSSAMLFATAACGTSDKADAGTDSAKGSDAATITSYDVSSVEKDDTIAALLPESVTKDGKLTIGTNPSYAPAEFLDADGKTQIGYEISFARYFYKPAPLRTLAEIRADILALEQQSEGLLHKIVGGAQ